MGPPIHVGVLLLLGAGFCAMALFAILLGFWSQRAGRWWRRFGVSTPGRVVRIDDSDEGKTHFVQYLDASGVVHETHTHSSGAEMRLGEVVEVFFDPGKPSRARIALDLANQRAVADILTLVFGGLGLALFVLGLVVWVVG